jgi:hypothetical protein
MIHIYTLKETFLWAACYGYVNCLKYLHEKGVDVADIDNWAIYLADENGHKDCVQYIKKVIS